MTPLETAKSLTFYSELMMVCASVYYYLNTRSLPTPFKDSLTAAQIAIRKQSSVLRRQKYYTGMMVGVVIAFLVYRYVDVPEKTRKETRTINKNIQIE